jgi:homoserine O-acetyltransferase
MKDGWGVPAGSRTLTLRGPIVFERGDVLPAVTLAYNTYGTLREDGANAVVVGHSLTSNSCVHEWWAPLLGAGPSFALDTSRYFVVCVNYLCSVYGSSGPLERRPMPAADGGSSTGDSGDGGGGGGAPYMADFPLPTIRDNVTLQRRLLDALGVRGLAMAVGGSLGGMLALEWRRATLATCVSWCWWRRPRGTPRGPSASTRWAGRPCLRTPSGRAGTTTQTPTRPPRGWAWRASWPC